jgi:hypothetical protein
MTEEMYEYKCYITIIQEIYCDNVKWPLQIAAFVVLIPVIEL